MNKKDDVIDNDMMLAMGERIRKARAEKGISSYDMAAALDMSRDNYSRIENGRQVCTTRNLYLIAKELSVSADYLLFDDSEDRYIAEVRMLFKGKNLDVIRKAVAIIRTFLG